MNCTDVGQHIADIDRHRLNLICRSVGKGPSGRQTGNIGTDAHETVISIFGFSSVDN